MQSTSVSADSSTIIVPAGSPTLSPLTIGMTTAEEVPARMAPRVSPLSQGSPSETMPTTVNATRVARKVTIVRERVGPTARRSTSMLRLVPLSSRMAIRVSVVITGPTLPKSSGPRNPVMGPISRPTRISRRTSGRRVRSNSAVKAWARK